MLAALMAVVTCAPAIAQHSHHQPSGSKPTPPQVFLDKSPRVVAYQLGRLDNERLLLVPRDDTDQKYIPVYEAILTRVGMPAQHREEAITALANLLSSSRVRVLLKAIGALDVDDSAERRVAEQLTRLLTRVPTDEVRKQAEDLVAAIQSEHSVVAIAAAAGLLMTDQAALLIDTPNSLVPMLAAIEFIPQAARPKLRGTVARQISESESVAVRRAAIRALGWIDAERDQTFQMVAPLVQQAELRDVAIETLLTVDPLHRDAETSAWLLRWIVDHAESTPAEQRTSDVFISTMQLADQLMTSVPPDEAAKLRSRLRAITVRLIRIKTVAEEMRYDTAYFAVEAGKPVQIILDNQDMMPHNLVITVPGALKEVAQLGMESGPRGGNENLAYVPDSNLVLAATEMVAAHSQTRLTFTAPQEPGEYPYVCTFPQHWYRMYGVMVVVEDLDDWLRDPVEPSNPIGSNRSFVRAWSMEDFRDDLEAGVQGRSPEIGRRIFVEASCAGCHKMEGQGGLIGPDLTGVLERFKGDRLAILREILEPSHKIDPKYTMQNVLTVDGRVVSGIVASANDDQVELTVSPDAKQPTVIPRDDIEQMTPAPTSIMPKALLDQFTKDEIFELLAYLLQ